MLYLYGLLSLVIVGLLLLFAKWIKGFERSDGWRQYEYDCSVWMRKHGYKQVRVGAGSSDGGVDVWSSTTVAQCKYYTGNVGVKDIRELYGVAQSLNKKAIFFTTKGYTKEARRFAKGRVKLVVYG